MPGEGAGSLTLVSADRQLWDSLRHHGDVDASDGLLDFAVNVHGTAPPDWLQRRLASRLSDLARYPTAAEDLAVRESVARRHGRNPDEVLLLSGAAEGFSLLAHLSPRCAAVVHPSFTEPEFALRQAGIAVQQVVVPPPFRLADATVPDHADLVVLGNPTNPTSVLHPRADIHALRRPGRVIVVDEAFSDVVPGEPETLAGISLPDVLVLRSLTKTWAIAGLRCGYLLGSPALLAELTRRRPHWPVGTLQLEAIRACCTPEALAAAEVIMQRIGEDRKYLIAALRQFESQGVGIVEPADASFLLLHVSGRPDLRHRLKERGIAVRRCDTFPGLSDDYVRVAVREREAADALLAAIREVL
ncbi:Rv2231c family pyridoxal phosphate-dependent protein CobC [Hoyosella altamirensis]|uniref:Rv2231c family pyridoxal phosphate-dependent protein CobC n=1 Tax=Hoyosella altamirensis TaxID=616997 RepID=UPI0007DB40B6